MITVAPTSTRFTTQDAGNLLGVSRPNLVKLLDSGLIPYVRPGRHRKVQLVDLPDYRDAAGAARGADLDELTREAVALGAYGSIAHSYHEALERARRQRSKAAR